MKDTEIRGLLLEKYYEHRRDGMVGFEPRDFGGQLTEKDILYVSSQLGEHRLIEWKAIVGKDGLAGGMGKITAAGVDVMEGHRRAPIAIHLVDQSVHISDSIGVAVGDNNQQTISIQLKELVQAIDKGPGLDADKRDAKSRLQTFLAHPLVSAIVGAAATILPNKSS